MKLIDSSYKKFSKWIISNFDRDNFLQATFKLLEKIKKNSQRLSDINTLYNLDQEMINNLKFDIEQTKIPFAQEELIDIFSSLNSKDKEIENYIKCVDLQIIKTEYNKVLVDCISNAQKHLKKIIDDVENKLRECEDMKFWGITEVKLYLKDHKMEKINLDIFNNEENQKNKNKNKGFSDSSEESSENDEKALKQFKMNLNVNSELLDNFDKNNITERKKIDNLNNNNLDNTTNRKKSLIKLVKGGDALSSRKNQKSLNKPKKKIILDYNDIKDEKDRNEDNDIGYINTINTKSRNNQYSNFKTSKTLKNEKYGLNKNDNNEEGTISKKKVKNELIQNLISSYYGDNKDSKFFSLSKNDSRNDFPLLLTNRNQNNNNNEKYIQQNYKKYNDSTKYGKKLNYALKQKTSKKD